jgi:hypothetical protein
MGSNWGGQHISSQTSTSATRRPFGADPTGGIHTVANAWLPGAGRLHSRHDGGSLQGGAPRAVWHTSEHSPLRISARSVAERLEQQGENAHLVWNPLSGEIVQMVPATLPACLLPGGVGREGRRCFQIVVVGFAGEPFTAGALEGLASIMSWLDVWQVPRRWPAGGPLPPPEAYHSVRSRRSWARGGHFGASQVPHANGPSAGGIDVRRLTGPEPRAPGVTFPAEAGELLARPQLIPQDVPAHAPASSRS